MTVLKCFEIELAQAVELYTNLNADGYLKKTEENEIWSTIQFVRNDLKNVALKILNQNLK